MELLCSHWKNGSAIVQRGAVRVAALRYCTAVLIDFKVKTTHAAWQYMNRRRCCTALSVPEQLHSALSLPRHMCHHCMLKCLHCATTALMMYRLSPSGCKSGQRPVGAFKFGL